MPALVLSPALPSELLAYVVDHCTYPTTLVVCASQADFVQALLAEDDGQNDDEHSGEGRQRIQKRKEQRNRLIQSSSSLLQVAVSRHIRVAFVPTVAHLRAFLAAFDPGASRVGPPPDIESSRSRRNSADTSPDRKMPDRPSLLVYGFVQLHQGTSEWSAQGLATSAAVLIETAWRVGFDAVMVDGRRRLSGPDATADDERVPVLSTVPRRQLQRAGYPLRTERVKSVLGRWFQFVQGAWDNDEEPLVAAEHVDAPQTPPREKPPIRDYVRDSEEESSLRDTQDDVSLSEQVA